MHEQAVGFINGCSRTGERASYRRTDASHAAKLYSLSGDYGSRPKKAQNIHKFKKTCKMFCPITQKKGTKGDTNLT